MFLKISPWVEPSKGSKTGPAVKIPYPIDSESNYNSNTFRTLADQTTNACDFEVVDFLGSSKISLKYSKFRYTRVYECLQKYLEFSCQINNRRILNCHVMIRVIDILSILRTQKVPFGATLALRV